MKLVSHFDEFPEMMTVNETADLLRIPRPTVYYLINKGKLPAVRISGRWRIRRSEVQSALNLHPVRANQIEKKDRDILVVEDDPLHQKLYHKFLSREGIRSDIAATGKEAISALKQKAYDQVFLDLQLPDQPGDEVYTALKNIEPDLPIVVATGYPDSHILDRILLHGPILVIRKPLDLSLLSRALG